MIPTEEEKKEYLAYKTWQDVLENLKSYEGDMAASAAGKTDILFCGAMAAFDKGILNFLNELVKANAGIKFCLLSEVTAEYRRYTAEKVKFPFVCTPHLFAKELVITGMCVPVSKEQVRHIGKKTFLSEALRNIKARQIGLGDGYAEAWVFYAYKYICAILELLSPRAVVLWNGFYAFHHIAKGVCREKKIAVMYMEFGCIPGTFCIERMGQQGESWPARKPAKFKRMEISGEEMEMAGRAIDYLKRTGLNRNIQPIKPFSAGCMKNYRGAKKTIVFFGHNEYESGVFPYNFNARKYHSPCFACSLAALKYLSVLAVKNDWNLIYKPHPAMVSLGHEEKNRKWAEYTDDVNINSLIDFSDLAVTIVSQTAYIALIREKPVLMLGYTQLKNKGCCYEAFHVRQIQKQMKKALREGYTEKQRENFRRHVAGLLKEYLYDDMQEKEMPLGKRELQGVFDHWTD